MQAPTYGGNSVAFQLSVTATNSSGTLGAAGVYTTATNTTAFASSTPGAAATGQSMIVKGRRVGPITVSGNTITLPGNVTDLASAAFVSGTTIAQLVAAQGVALNGIVNPDGQAFELENTGGANILLDGLSVL